MGRTLHYSIRRNNGRDFTVKQRKILLEIAEKYNSGKFKNAWTCENYYFTAENYYPNWKRYGGKVDSWDEVNAEYGKLEAKGMDHFDIIERLYATGYVRYHRDNLKKIHGFTKTQGNEYNSLLVYTALIEVSKRLPDTIVHLSDEGEFLICPVYIANGLVKPDIDDLKKDIKRFEDGVAEGKEYFQQYIDEYEGKLKTIQHILNESENAEWLEPSLMARLVDINDFKDYKGTIMGGFCGEYFNLDPNGEHERLNDNIRQFIHVLSSDTDTKVISIEDKE